MVFALSMKGALRKILQSWGSRLTWVAQRQHAAQIVVGINSFHCSSSFLSTFMPNMELDPEPDSLRAPSPAPIAPSLNPYPPLSSPQGLFRIGIRTGYLVSLIRTLIMKLDIRVPMFGDWE